MNRPRTHWVLDADKRPRPVSMLEWATWFETFPNRRVALTEFADGSSVSTVFIGLDMNLCGGAPQLFETMLFYGPGSQPEGETWHPFNEGLCQRYATWTDAEDGHRGIVEALSASLNSPTLLAATQGAMEKT